MGHLDATKKMVYVENMLNTFNEVYVGSVDYGEGVFLLFICGLISLIVVKKLSCSKRRFPPGPFAWPLVGHLHLFTNLPHQNLRDLSRKYGAMVGLELGQQRAVAISSPELAKEVLATHDKVFANRPPHDFLSLLLYGPTNDLLFGPHGRQWRKHRKLCFMTLFTAKRLQEFEYIRQEEMASLLLRLHGHATAATPINIVHAIGHMFSYTVMRLLQSKASLLFGQENALDLIRELEHEASFPTLGDVIPCLSFLDFLRKQQMRRLHHRVDKAVSTLIAERKKSSAPHDDLLQALLSKEAGHDPSTPPQETFTLEEIKSILVDVLSAGIHTTSNTLEWAMSEILRNPLCFQRVREEIDRKLGKKKQITDADVANLSYLKCVVKEVLRLHPVLPLLLPRISSEECEVAGYTLPANTYMFVNVWAIHRDETLWGQANKFIPERFEGKDMDVKGQNYELLPFGSGRRVCLGMPMALSVLEVTLANLVNSFDWELPHGETPTSICMSEHNGLTATKATPLTVIPKPRISL